MRTDSHKSSRLSVNMPPDIYKKIRQMAESECMTMRDLVIEALQEKVWRDHGYSEKTICVLRASLRGEDVRDTHSSKEFFDRFKKRS